MCEGAKSLFGNTKLAKTKIILEILTTSSQEFSIFNEVRLGKLFQNTLGKSVTSSL